MDGNWGMGWLLIVSQWIIPENSRRFAPVRKWIPSMTWYLMTSTFWKPDHLERRTSKSSKRGRTVEQCLVPPGAAWLYCILYTYSQILYLYLHLFYLGLSLQYGSSFRKQCLPPGAGHWVKLDCNCPPGGAAGVMNSHKLGYGAPVSLVVSLGLSSQTPPNICHHGSPDSCGLAKATSP